MTMFTAIILIRGDVIYVRAVGKPSHAVAKLTHPRVDPIEATTFSDWIHVYCS